MLNPFWSPFLCHFRAAPRTLRRPASAICPEPVLDRALADLPTPQEMHLLLQREQELCGRGRPPCAVVVFAVGDPAADSGPAMRLLQAFRHRNRVSDTLGWLGPGQMALLLPATTHDGAHRIAVDINELLAGHGDAPAFRMLNV